MAGKVSKNQRAGAAPERGAAMLDASGLGPVRVLRGAVADDRPAEEEPDVPERAQVYEEGPVSRLDFLMLGRRSRRALDAAYFFAVGFGLGVIVMAVYAIHMRFE